MLVFEDSDGYRHAREHDRTGVPLNQGLCGYPYGGELLEMEGVSCPLCLDEIDEMHEALRVEGTVRGILEGESDEDRS